ncbi:glycosyltransferase family 2 protein [Kosmotoga pacifica]|uniref:glycosyltransferase family 2 protein n=1 Tax=Kosmotoga pacifica TaxID=1330330 RepID=UPI00069C3CB0|nr:glycosyltransferase family 2 protein [Kosmotoga pacifica]
MYYERRKISIKVSVIIPTIGRSALLNCLQALYKNSYKNFEVVVVNDNPSVDITIGLSEFINKDNLTLINNTNQKGPAYARNLGARHAKGELLAFLDDDTIPSENWLDAAVNFFEFSPDIAAIVGKTIPRDEDALSPFHHYMRHNGKSGYPACNLFVRNEIFKEVGGFSEEYFNSKHRIYHYEDADLALRILSLGYKIEYIENVIVYHPSHTRSFLQPIKIAKKSFFDPLLQYNHPFEYSRLRSKKFGFLRIKNIRTRSRFVIALDIILIPIFLLVFKNVPLTSIALILYLFSIAFIIVRKSNKKGLAEIGFKGIILAFLIETLSIFAFIYFYILGNLSVRSQKHHE